MLGRIRRNYTSYIRPIMEYCDATVWNCHGGVCNSTSLEKIQRRSVGIVTKLNESEFLKWPGMNASLWKNAWKVIGHSVFKGYNCFLPFFT